MSDEQRKLLCAVCNRNKGLHLFYKRSSTKRGYTKECKSCYRQRPVHQRSLDQRYQRIYGITLQEYAEILLEQGGRCFICQRKAKRRRLAVDHDHKRTGRESIRGLLCRDCNEYIGRTGEAPEVGLRLAEYLTRPYWVERVQ